MKYTSCRDFAFNKKVVLGTVLISALLLGSVSALAFGGGGGGRHSQYYKRHTGIGGMGIHYHTDGSDKPVKIIDLSGDPNAEEISPGIWQCKGGYILNVDEERCDACPSGTYAAAGASSCTTTPAGTYAPEASSEPIPCPVGTYNAHTGAAECTPADPGYYTGSTGATDQTECQAGYYMTAAVKCAGVSIVIVTDGCPVVILSRSGGVYIINKYRASGCILSYISMCAVDYRSEFLKLRIG